MIKSLWSDDEVKSEKVLSSAGVFDDGYGMDLAYCLYITKLVGRDSSLVIHGGGNTSVKSVWRDIYGNIRPSIFVKASGVDMVNASLDDFTALHLDNLLQMSVLTDISDELMINEFRVSMFNHRHKTPSLETLVHALLPFKYVVHTHPDNILILSNQHGAKHLITEALGKSFIILDYVTPGFKLAKAIFKAFEDNKNVCGIVLMNHGLITWAESARDAYEETINAVNRAGEFIKASVSEKTQTTVNHNEIDNAKQDYRKIAPIMRGLLSKNGNVILEPLITPLARSIPRELVLTTSITTDYLIRTKAFPLCIDSFNDENGSFRDKLRDKIDSYSHEYERYVARNLKDRPEEEQDGLKNVDSMPRVIFVNGVGAICVGKDVINAKKAKDITKQTIKVKLTIDKMGSYDGLSEEDVFAMEYRTYQHMKLDDSGMKKPLSGKVALITGAAGAIGSGICRELLSEGAHVVITDLDEKRLDDLYNQYGGESNPFIFKAQMDVTNPLSVADAFGKVVECFGGVDIIVINAGIAMVSKISDMELSGFQQLERVNVDGTLNVLKEGGNLLKTQSIGGDIILISTKNVFAPGAGFGAYSATKAASHQLARIASLELAEDNVRVNMVSPDGVFSDGGAFQSGLWQTVGPDRMRARGLDEKGLEEYYQNRNLLKAKITPTHVARAVLFFATQQTPTTGATIPVDGGLPDSTPR